MLIGIGGCSRSGKTTLADLLVWHIRSQLQATAFVIHQDNFVKNINEIPGLGDFIDWESPTSIDFELLKEAIDFFQHRFDYVLVEGILAFADALLNQMYDRTYFVEISENTFYQRRRQENRWGIEPMAYLDHVWKSFLQNGQPSQTQPNLLRISGKSPFKVEDITAHLLPV
ncbi:MAG: hypothetical protein ACK4GN_05535 [Runella sp.]